MKNYDYYLPEERIAQYPLSERDKSKLLIYRNNLIKEDIFSSIDNYLPKNSLLVFNDTKVIQARLIFRKKTGAKIEIFCLEPAGDIKDFQYEFNKKGSTKWNCLVGNKSKWMSGKLEMNFLIKNSNCIITAEVKEKENDVYLIEFKWDPEKFCFSEVLSAIGNTPLPPYIKRKSENLDKERYQTVFAINEGSVAAPTAALHFTKEIFKNLQDKNIQTEYITLNVGAGTFKPVKSEKIGGHLMHTESFSVSKSTLANIIHSDKQIVSVGTTTLRTLESLYWMGEKLINKKHEPFIIKQWYPYERNHMNLPPFNESLQSIIDFLDNNQMDVLYGKTDIIIVPGYSIKSSNVLITNFHMPRSTLLLLIAAFTGDDWKKIYDYALINDFRFLSYGDSSILFKK